MDAEYRDAMRRYYDESQVDLDTVVEKYVASLSPPTEAPPAVAPPVLTGRWEDSADGALFVAQIGDGIKLTGSADRGAFGVRGSGTVRGYEVDLTVIRTGLPEYDVLEFEVASGTCFRDFDTGFTIEETNCRTPSRLGTAFVPSRAQAFTAKSEGVDIGAPCTAVARQGVSSRSTSPRSSPLSSPIPPFRTARCSPSSGASATRAWSRSAAISTASPTPPGSALSRSRKTP